MMLRVLTLVARGLRGKALESKLAEIFDYFFEKSYCRFKKRCYLCNPEREVH